MEESLNQLGLISDQSLEEKTIVMSEAEGDCDTFVNSTLTCGTLKFAESRGWSATGGSTFIDCEIIAVKRRKNTQFFDTRFIRCHFKGTFFGVDFGHLENQAPPFERDEFGRAEHCDFSQARLDGCRFFNTDISTLKFPGWPHVVIPDPHSRAQEIDKVSWPGTFAGYMKICTTHGRVSPSASVIYAPTLAKMEGCTPEEIRTAFEHFGGVLM